MRHDFVNLNFSYAIAENIRFGIETECLLPIDAVRVANSRQRWSTGQLLLEKKLNSDMNIAALLGEDAGLLSFVVEADSTIDAYLDELGYEIKTPVLNGANGLAVFRHSLFTLAALGAYTNESCGLHVHWSVQDGRLQRQQFANFLTAARQQMPVYHTMIGPERVANKACLRDFSLSDERMDEVIDDLRHNRTCPLLKTLPSLAHDQESGETKHAKINLLPMQAHQFKEDPDASGMIGTTEHRARQGVDFYDIDATVEHVATIINFISEALDNPAATYKPAMRTPLRLDPPCGNGLPCRSVARSVFGGG